MPAAQAAGRDASPANRGGLNSERGLLRQTTTPNTSPNSSQRQWLIDLAELLREARQRFGDVSWTSAAGGPKTYAHKFVLYARAPGAFVRDFVEDVTAEAEDHGLLDAALDYFYTAQREAEVFAVVLDGFRDEDGDGSDAPPKDESAVHRLHRDLMYCWRSRLFADATLVVESAPESPFPVHRAMLASRTAYFRALLLGDFADSGQGSFALPSPPFTPASTTFVLSWIYGGSLELIARHFDLATAFEIWRCAAFLDADTLREEVEFVLERDMTQIRAPRILTFSRCPDVNSERLSRSSTDLVVRHFDTTWTSSHHVGLLPYSVQLDLLEKVTAGISATNVVKIAVRLAAARRNLPSGPGEAWVEHVRAMLDGLQDRIIGMLAADLPEALSTPDFADLVEGVGFSSDVLEWLLGLVIQGLDERCAPVAYETLLFEILQREVSHGQALGDRNGASES
ncbi:hypothetical protein JCM8202_001944 [Rhodotorula sphaerocarpa]